MNSKNSSLIYTTLYYDALAPLLDFLKIRKREINVDIWITTVNLKKEEIIQNPVRHLGIELSLRNEMAITIENIFSEFLKRELLLNLS